MAFSDYARALLEGGLPEVLDVGRTPTSSTRQGDRFTERNAPNQTLQDQEPFSSRLAQGATLENMVLILVAGAALVGIIFFVSRR